MAGEWQELTLEQAMAAVIDYRGKTPRKVLRGIPLITAKIVKSGRIEAPNEFIAEEDYDDWMRRGLPQRGDVLLTTEAPLGEVAQVNDPRIALAQRLVCLRGRPGFVDNDFLRFLMQSAPVQAQLHSRASGTTVLGIKQSELRKIVLSVPPLAEQRAISHILGTLDDKIELNRRMSEALEAMARTLFKSWFVNFDPVRAKAEGRDLGLPKPLADLFPAHLVDSELGEIPEGWHIGTLGDVADHPRRGIQPDSIEPDTPYIALEHMPKRCIALSDWAVADGLESNKFEFRKAEILFGKLRPYFHKVGIAPVDGVCSTDIVVVSPKSAGWFGFVLGNVSSVEFVEYTSAGSTGTKMPRTSWTEMARYTLALPPQAVARAFAEKLQPSFDRIIAGVHESRTLAALRDALLPRLISGELRIKDAENFVGSVA